MDASLAAHVAILHDFGEWQITSRILQTLKMIVPTSPPLHHADPDAPMSDEAFVRQAYNTILGREPDPAGLQHHLGLIASGITREALLCGLRDGAEAQAKLASPATGGTESSSPLSMEFITLDEVLALRGRAFLQAAYRSVLGRQPDNDGMAHHLKLLNDGARPSAILVGLKLSPEGRSRPIKLKGLDKLLRRHRLLQTPLLGRLLYALGWDNDPGEVMRSLRLLENQVYRLTETKIAPPTPCPATPDLVIPASVTPSIATPPTKVDPAEPSSAGAIILDTDPLAFDRPTNLVLLGADKTLMAGGRRFDAAFYLELAGVGSAYRLTVWDSDQKRLRLASLAELAAVGFSGGVRHPTRYPANKAALIAPGEWAADGWLVVPYSLRKVDEPELVEMNVILEARRLGLRTAFMFEGAAPLVDHRYADAASEGHELFMQALLLADLVLAGSREAQDELVDFFIQHQCADFHPPVSTLPQPDQTRGPAAWEAYARQLNALFAVTSNPSRRLTGVYYLVDAGGLTPFDRNLVAGLTDCKIPVVLATWNHNGHRFAALPVRQGDEALSATWIEPLAEGAPDWVLCPQVDGPDLLSVQAYAFTKKLRVATILRGHDAGVAFGHATWQITEALGKMDKIFAVSEDQFDAFYRSMLGWRGKFHSADHRLVIAPPPATVIYPRANSANGSGAIRVLVRIPTARPADLVALSSALANVQVRAAGRIELTLSRGPDQPPAEVSTLQARWIAGSDKDAHRRELERSDCMVFAGLDGADRSEVNEALAWRIPCLCQGKASSPHAPGIVHVDLAESSALADAILHLLQPTWAACLTEEASTAVVRDWRHYAKILAAQMATDHPRDAACPAKAASATSIYDRFVNLRRRPKLSICISTYNRGGWIALNLQNLFDQIGPARSEIEVLVVDNTSTDHTPEVAAKWAGRPDFRYVRNPRNVGMLGNLAVTAQRARGEYIWILGDDDFTRTGVIDQTLAILNNRPETELVYFNYGYTSEPNPANVESLDTLLNTFNVLEPDGPDMSGTVADISAKNENFYTAIYAFAARRDHVMRAYCQDTSGRIFSTMISCIPTAHYILNYMPSAPAYWIGRASLVVNSNVSWAAYGALLDLEHLPAAWDLAERMGGPAAEIDRRRANRLWLVEMMWREIFENDAANNSPYFSAARTLMRLKHLPELDRYVPELRAIYERARASRHPAATLDSAVLFSGFDENIATV